MGIEIASDGTAAGPAFGLNYLSSRRNPFPRGGLADVATVVRRRGGALVLASLFSRPPPTGSSLRGRTIQPLLE